MSDKNFIGNCKKVQNWGVKVGLHKDKCVFDERGWMNIVIVPNLDSEDKKAYAYLDEWKPTRQEESAEKERRGFQPNDPIEPNKDDINSLPF